MISKEEFEQRVRQWWDLVFSAQTTYAHRRIDADLEITREGDEKFFSDMAAAEAYATEFLPEEILAHFMDPLVPAEVREDASRLDILRLTGSARRMTANVIELAKYGRG